MQKPPIILTNVLLFSLTGLAAITLVPYEALVNGYDRFEILSFILLTGFAGMSITAGYHRLWSHKTYEAHPVLRFILALGGAFALQNSILHWSSDHRIHHKHVDDNDKDPYSAKRGFWYSHIGWMLREYQAQRYSDYANCRDLQKDPIVMWQHKYYLPLVLIMNIGLPVFLGWLNGDIWGMFLLAGVLRLVISHHVTFFINSLAHIWGKQTYTDKNTAKDNGFLAFVTYGEGYHNFHHIFEHDYRNGVRWFHYDPTKWLIYGCSLIGLTRNLRKVPDERIVKARITMELQSSVKRIAHLPNADELLAKLQHEYDLLVHKLGEYYATRKRLMDIKKRKLIRELEKLELDYKYQEMKLHLQLQMQKWSKLNSMQFA
ncbi:acyl-CoA desaturase [Neptunicella marina]|uniref:Fatty acid desaturase n=1 Tax=Neptunicella marina TaxID=2125989 RepID=A0A8J6M7A1_9ALTE|nr:fatty acid desaturase [Neptunicella marina]MBC3767526.1 fatty acid desaturase [Neptunicella marina]